MTLIIAVVILLAVTLFYTLFIRAKDIPAPEPVSPTQQLDERKARIYENLRDLQFEYRVGKLSDADYQRTKLDLQAGLAVVLGEIDKLKQMEGVTVKTKSTGKKPDTAKVCPHCAAKFEKALKFCGECGKPMVAEAV